MHAVLHLQTNGFHSSPDQALEQRLNQTRGSSLLAHDNRTQLAVVSNKHNLFGSENDGYEALRLCRLRTLVNQYFLERARRKARVAGADTRAAHDVSGHENLALGYAFQAAEFLVVGG